MWKIAVFLLTTEPSNSGTPCYRSPESIGESPQYSEKSDIWALGCIFYELIFSESLFDGDLSLREYANSGDSVNLPLGEGINDNTRRSISRVIEEALHRVPGMRPSASGLESTFANMPGIHPRNLRVSLQPSRC